MQLSYSENVIKKRNLFYLNFQFDFIEIAILKIMVGQ